MPTSAPTGNGVSGRPHPSFTVAVTRSGPRPLKIGDLSCCIMPLVTARVKIKFSMREKKLSEPSTAKLDQAGCIENGRWITLLVNHILNYCRRFLPLPGKRGGGHPLCGNLLRIGFEQTPLWQTRSSMRARFIPAVGSRKKAHFPAVPRRRRLRPSTRMKSGRSPTTLADSVAVVPHVAPGLDSLRWSLPSEREDQTLGHLSLGDEIAGGYTIRERNFAIRKFIFRSSAGSDILVVASN